MDVNLNGNSDTLPDLPLPHFCAYKKLFKKSLLNVRSKHKFHVKLEKFRNYFAHVAAKNQLPPRKYYIDFLSSLSIDKKTLSAFLSRFDILYRRIYSSLKKFDAIDSFGVDLEKLASAKSVDNINKLDIDLSSVLKDNINLSTITVGNISYKVVLIPTNSKIGDNNYSFQNTVHQESFKNNDVLENIEAPEQHLKEVEDSISDKNASDYFFTSDSEEEVIFRDIETRHSRKVCESIFIDDDDPEDNETFTFPLVNNKAFRKKVRNMTDRPLIKLTVPPLTFEESDTLHVIKNASSKQVVVIAGKTFNERFGYGDRSFGSLFDYKKNKGDKQIHALVRFILTYVE